MSEKVRLGDGHPCHHPPSVLEDLGAVVVYAGQAGRNFGDHQNLRRREVEAEEKAAAIRADLQRMLRDAQTTLVVSSRPSAWPEVREHARKASSELAASVERWQEQAQAACERTRKNLAQYQRDIASAMRDDLHAYARACVAPSRDAVTVVRRLGAPRYVDTLRFEVAAALSAELEVEPAHCEVPTRLRAWVKRVELQAGVRKGLFGREKPRMLRLDGLYVVEAVLSPSAIDLRLAAKLKGNADVLLLRLRPEGGRIRGRLTLAEGQHEDAVGEETLQALWDALQRARLEVVARPATVTSVDFDGETDLDAEGCFAAAERIMERWRPIVRELVKHTPSPDELCVLLPSDDGPDDELWVRTADLTQHLLTIPTALRFRLAPRELLGPAAVTRESDIIDLGRVLTPDAGDDSDVISLHYIPPEGISGMVEAGAPSPILELESGDISVLDLGRDPEENSGCYDLSKLGRSAQSG